jgi:PAS domain S-box-containing protein/TyrR family helix-turn-helix protein
LEETDTYKRLAELLSLVFESSSDGIWVCDGNGKIISINKASEQINGVQANDIVGRNESEDYIKNMFDRSVSLEVLNSKQQISFMQYIKKTRKHIWVTGTPVFDKEEKISLIVVNERDVTQLNDLKAELKETKLEFEKAKDKISELSMLELNLHNIVAESEKMKQVLKTAHNLAQRNASNILILGESGTGKGILAKFIHNSSSRRKNPFVQINCAALPENLLEAELFGYEKGAFTGARDEGKAGLIEIAKGGTLFLDEMGDLPPSIQAKFLKYFDDQKITRLGSTKSQTIDCSIIAATNRNLEALVKSGQFRKDLFFRLETFTLQIPPLRDREEDIFELTRSFLEYYNDKYNLKRKILPEALEELRSYSFPGNVRELENMLKRAIVMSEKDVLDDFIIQLIERRANSLINTYNRGYDNTKLFDDNERINLPEKLQSVERDILKNAISRCNSTRKLATHLGVSQATVVRKIKKYKLAKSK